MDEESKKARNLYYQAYRRKNKEKIEEIKNRYWRNKAEELKLLNNK